MPTPSRTKNNMPWLIGAIVAAGVAIAAVLAVSLSGDDEPTTVPASTTLPGGSAPAGSAPLAGPPSGGTGAASATSRQPAESQPVTITGAALPEGEGDGDSGVGLTPPIVSGFSLDGTPISLDPADGPMMVVFLAHWCPHCNREIPVLRQWFDSGAVPKDLRVVGVSTAVRQGADHYPPSAWLQSMSWPWPNLADSEDQQAAASYGVTGFPYIAIIGQDGKVKARSSGEVPLAELSVMVSRALSS